MKSVIAFVAVLCVIAAVESSPYGPAPAKMTGPPCPKSVVVGCAPLVQTVPCKSGGAAVAAPHGAYSEFYPQYVAPADYNGYPQYGY